jgi:hypothetical protein
MAIDRKHLLFCARIIQATLGPWSAFECLVYVSTTQLVPPLVACANETWVPPPQVSVDVDTWGRR